MNRLVPVEGLALENRRLPKKVAVRVESTLEAADGAGSPIRFIGLAPTFAEVRVYRDVDRDWTFAPVSLDPVYQEHGGRLPVPAESLEALRRLVDAGIDFPETYIAHDIPSGAVELAANAQSVNTALVRSGGPTIITPETALQVVKQPGPHPRTVELARRYGRISKGMMVAFAAAGAMAGAIVAVAAAPLLIVGSATGAGAAVGVDPILFGAVPLRESDSPHGAAAWYVLDQWSY